VILKGLSFSRLNERKKEKGKAMTLDLESIN